MQKVYNTKEVATILKVQPLTVRQYILAKQLKASYIGRQYLVCEQDLQEFINRSGQV